MTRPLGASLGDLFARPLNDAPGRPFGSLEMSNATMMANSTVFCSGMTLAAYRAAHNGKNCTIGSPFPTSVPTSFPTSTPVKGGGAGLGYGYTSVLFLGIVIALTTYMHIYYFDAVSEDDQDVKESLGDALSVQAKAATMDGDEHVERWYSRFMKKHKRVLASEA